MNILNDCFTHKRTTATALIKSGAGITGGWLVAASSSGTLTLYDGIDNTGVLMVNAFPLVAGTFIPYPASIRKGIYVVIGGTADISFLYS